MTSTIAVAGKGGTGKTTIAGLLIRRLAAAQAGPILAIDADPASNLNTVLDLPLEKTVGDVREETSEKAAKLRAAAAVVGTRAWRLVGRVVDAARLHLAHAAARWRAKPVSEVPVVELLAYRMRASIGEA